MLWCSEQEMYLFEWTVFQNRWQIKIMNRRVYSDRKFIICQSKAVIKIHIVMIKVFDNNKNEGSS